MNHAGSGAFRMGPDGMVYRVPAPGLRSAGFPGVSGGLPVPAAFEPVPEDDKARDRMRDLLKDLPQFPEVAPC